MNGFHCSDMSVSGMQGEKKHYIRYLRHEHQLLPYKDVPLAEDALRMSGKYFRICGQLSRKVRQDFFCSVNSSRIY